MLFSLVLFVFPVKAATLFPSNTTWKYFLGTNEPSPDSFAAWRQIDFNDSTWADGVAPIGYANPPNDPGGFEARIVTVLRPGSSLPVYTSVYLRKTFVVADPAAVADLTLTASYDDGVLTWINGVQLGRNRVSGWDLPYNAASTSQAETITTAFALTNASSVLVPGTNVVAVHLLNGNAASLDLFFEASLANSLDRQPPVVVKQLPPPGAAVRSLPAIEVFFSELVTNVGAGDLLINGTPATNVIDVNGSQFLFEFPPPPTGAVSVAFANNHGITDLAPGRNPFAGADWSYMLNPNALVAGVVISEFMAKNDHGIRDEDGDQSDWIELFNGSGVDLNLDGWYLTDTPLNLAKWRVPSVGLPASGYLLIYASGKNRTNSAAPLHTNFRLSDNARSYLALVDPSGTNVVSSFASYPKQFPDVSYGRDRNDPSIAGYYTNATPNAPNAVTGSGFAPDVSFSKTSSTFVAPFALTLATADPNTVIRYFLVTNAATAAATNVPNLNSPIYANPIPITGPAIVRARAFSQGAEVFPGAIRSETFLRLDPDVLDFSSDLPLIIIHNFGAGAYPSSQAEVLSAFAVFDNTLDRASLTNTPVLMTRAGLHLRGYSTLSYPKSSFAVEFQDEFNDAKSLPLLEMPEESDWVLYAPNNVEPVMMHNPLFYRMSREIGRYASRTRFAEVFLNTGGGALGTSHYNGIYVVEEKVKRSSDRVNIARLDVEDTNAPAITGGYLLAVDWVDPGEPTYIVAGVGSVPAQTIVYHYPKGEILQLPQRDRQEQYINAYLRNFVTNLAGPAFNTATGYAQYIDVDSWIDYLESAIATLNTDALRWSTYFFKDRDKPIEMGPVWDCDRCMGSTDDRNFNPRTWAGGGTDYFNWSWWGRLYNDPNFFQRYIDRYQQLRQAAYSETNLFAIIDGFAAELREAQPRESARWQVPMRGTNGTGAGTFATEVQWLKNWFAARLYFMDTNFLSPVTFDRAGGLVAPGAAVTLTPPNRVGGMTTGSTNSVVYYTLNGADPRASGGGVLPGARSNLGPATLTITSNVHLFARAFNRAHRNLTGANNPPLSSSWSGPTEATFYIDTPSLRITEIMYHPRAEVAGDTNNAGLFEYIEVKNTGGVPLNVNGFRLRGGVSFDFPNEVLAAGESAVIVKNVSAFQSRYGIGVRILGEFLGNLGNGGDHLVLEGSAREPILDFNYHDGWCPMADGLGFSLQVLDESAAPDTWGLKQSWRLSGVENGTPGAHDPNPPDIPPVVVNEILTHTFLPDLDAIELLNPLGAPVDIGNWWLTDDFNNPRKYRLPFQTNIPAGGYLVFDESQFNTGPGAFALSAQGDQVYLFSGDANGDLTGYFHGFSFGAQVGGATFGRYVISTGEEHFVRQITNTLHGPNSGPLVGPVVVSEINYHPLDIHYPLKDVNNTEDEYLELVNITGEPVPLYDPANPGHTWRLRDAVDFQFPTNVILAANERILVVSFTPTNGPQLAAFKARNGVPAGVRAFGPWDGQLDNAGDSVELAQPDLPEPGPVSEVAYVLVDQARYQDAAPWPSGADGSGPSLHRQTMDAYGNDPANWVAAARSPGLPYWNSGIPLITQQPQGGTNMVGDPVMLSASAQGPAPLFYQWRHDGAAVWGATNSTLVMPSALMSQAGAYDLVVFNASGAATSAPAVLKLRMPAQITAQPQSQIVQPGTNVSLSVSVISYEPPVWYQWYCNGSLIPGATNAVYSIGRVGLADQGSYYVAVRDGVTATNSASADLRVVIPPVILVQPLSRVDTPMGGTATLSVTVSNTVTLPLSFRWRKAGISIPGAFFILNDYTSILTLPNVTNPIPMNYSVLVTNIANRIGVLSANATVAAVPDSDHDGIPDAVEGPWGLDAKNAADADADADDDTMTNLEEYIAGTDPKDPASYLRVGRITPLSKSVLVEFQAISNRTYTVEFTGVLAGGAWTKLGSVSARATNYPASVPDAQPGGSRWYRLLTPAHQ